MTDFKDRIPYTAPWSDAQLVAIKAAALTAGDLEKADLVHTVQWAREFCDQALAASRALAREARRVFGPVLDQERPKEEQLRRAIAEMLDDKPAAGRPLRSGSSFWAAHVLVEDLRLMVEPAANFVEMLIETPSDGPYRVIVQKPEGKSPSVLIAELKAEIAELKSKVEDLSTAKESELHEAHDIAQAIVERIQCQGANGEETIKWGAEQILTLLRPVEDRRDLMGHVVLGDRKWSTPICHGAEGSAYPYHVFLWNAEGYGNTPEEALEMLREEMLHVAVEDRDTQGEETKDPRTVWVEEE